jgi:hypothetical protein
MTTIAVRRIVNGLVRLCLVFLFVGLVWGLKVSPTVRVLKVCALVCLLSSCDAVLAFSCWKVSVVCGDKRSLRFFSSSLLKPSPVARLLRLLRLLRLDFPVEEVGAVCVLANTGLVAGGFSTLIVLAVVRASAYTCSSSYPQWRVE